MHILSAEMAALSEPLEQVEHPLTLRRQPLPPVMQAAAQTSPWGGLSIGWGGVGRQGRPPTGFQFYGAGLGPIQKRQHRHTAMAAVDRDQA